MLSIASLTEVFPGARFHADWQLVTWFPQGVLDNERADKTVEFLEANEVGDGVPFHRFTDMSGYRRILLGFEHVVRLARRRREGYKGPPVRSALLAERPISVSIARMYEELMLGSNIQVCTFRSRETAAEWLGVPESILQPAEVTSSESSQITTIYEPEIER